MDIKLNHGQACALDMVKNYQISVLSGSAGTGKTTAVKMIINWAISQSMRVLCCCPSGKAAKRMNEATGFPAATIHKALQAHMEKGQFVFLHNESDPVMADLIIVDECSMVGNSLLAKLLAAVPEGCKVLLIGDPRQLPSVQAGNVFLDIIKSECIPHTALTETFRFSGDIIKACTAIRDGHYYTPSSTLDPDSGKNLRHIECDNQEHILDIITTLIKERIPERGYHPIWDCQVISPVNERGALSCKAINTRLRNELNPLSSGSIQAKDTEFRVGDKVINTKNREISLTAKQPSYIVNGDMGEVFIIPTDKKQIGIRFFDPERETMLPKKDKSILGAYCITCHRMQGSEAPVVIIPVHKSFGRSLNRAWIYTAISRGKEIVITVGQQDAINAAIGNNSSIQRKTRLKEKLFNNFIQDI